MTKKPIYLRRMCLTLLVLLACVLGGCTTQTGTRIKLTEAGLSGIQTCGVFVKQQEGFSVRLERERLTGTGAVLGGLLGAGIETGIRQSHDEHLTKDLLPVLGEFAPSKLMQDKLREYLEAAQLFGTVVLLDSNDRATLKEMHCDALLEVTLTQWGLVVCNSTRADDRLQAGIDVHEKLSRLTDGRPVWERNALHLDGNCYFTEQYKSKDRLLVDELTRAIDDLAARTVNEIRYPQNASEGGSR
jgi:hypothetical protein